MPNIDYMKSITFQVNGDDWIKLAVREGEEPSPAWQHFIDASRTGTIVLGSIGNVDKTSISVSDIQQFIVNGHCVVVAKLDNVYPNTIHKIQALKKINESGANAVEVVYTELGGQPGLAFWPHLEEAGYGDYNGVIRAYLEGEIWRVGATGFDF